jgi:hypothetical protein
MPINKRRELERFTFTLQVPPASAAEAKFGVRNAFKAIASYVTQSTFPSPFQATSIRIRK